jgi:hypothetical protein
MITKTGVSDRLYIFYFIFYNNNIYIIIPSKAWPPGTWFYHSIICVKFWSVLEIKEPRIKLIQGSRSQTDDVIGKTYQK